MNAHAKTLPNDIIPLIKADVSLPCFIVTGRDTIAIRAGTALGDVAFAAETPIAAPRGGYEAGCDYVVLAVSGGAEVYKLDGPGIGTDVIGGFHFAPGGNAAARAGGDDIPAINPHSAWDRNFRPTCVDPRGMTLVEGMFGKFWCDIYLLGVDHLKQGSSRFGVTIADDSDRPTAASGKPTKSLDYATAVAALAHHGKSLLGLYDFPDAAFGVTEKTSCRTDPNITSLDALRTSKWGVMQATGNMWVWGHDGDPDTPRASLFGGSWWHVVDAGSRCAVLGSWPDYSDGNVGARGRSDHLQLA